MAANTDKFRKVLGNFATTLASGITDTDTTIPLSSTAGLPADTAVTLMIDRIDANGDVKDSSEWELITGVVSGNNIINALRGEGSTSASAHDAGAVVEMVVDEETWNDLIDGILAEHNQDGTHSNITADSVTVAGDISATGDVSSATVTSSGQVAGSVLRLDEQSSAPSTPSTDKYVVYVKSDGYLYYKDDTGTERRWYPPQVDNDVAYQAKDSGGTARNVAKVNTSNVLEIGDANLDSIDLKNLIGSSVQHCCILQKTANQTLPNNTATTLTWDSEVKDQGGLADLTTDNTKITIQKSGFYLIGYLIQWVANSNGSRLTHLRRNGLSSNDTLGAAVPAEGTWGNKYTRVLFKYLSAGDYLQLKAQQNSGGNLDIRGDTNDQYASFFWVVKLF